MSMLPQGWVRVPLAEVCDILDSRRVPVNGSERAQRLGSVPYYGATGQVGWIDSYLFDEELVLLGEDGAPFLEPNKAKAYLVSGKSWVNNHAHVLRAKGGVLSSWLMYQLNALDYRPYVSGTTRLKLPQGPMRQIPILVPPLREQRRIVTALEEHLSALDAAVAGLERARTRLNLYVKSSVQAAVSNMLELGSMDRETNTEFEWKPLAAVISDIGQGWSPRCLPDPPANAEDWAVIKTTAIQPFRFDCSECKGLPEGLSPRPEIEIQVGDLLVTRKGPRSRAGVAAAVKQTRSRVMICDTVYRIRLKEVMARPHFMAIAMSSTVVAAAIDRAKAGISESGLSLTHDRLGAVLVPLPPLEVQEAIENEIDRRMQVVDRVNADIDLQLARAARVRESILQRAFSGELVSQEPGDQPAEALFAKATVSAPPHASAASSPRGRKPATTTRRADG